MRIWNYFEDSYYTDTHEQVAVKICGFNGDQSGNYCEGKLNRTKVEVRVRKLKNGRATGKDEITGRVIKSGSDMV